MDNNLTVRVSSTEECHDQFLRQGLQVEKETSISSSIQQSLGPGVSKEPDVHGHSVGLQGWAASPQSDGYRSQFSGSSDLFGHFSTGGGLCHSPSRLLNIRGRQLKQNILAPFVYRLQLQSQISWGQTNLRKIFLKLNNREIFA